MEALQELEKRIKSRQKYFTFALILGIICIVPIGAALSSVATTVAFCFFGVGATLIFSALIAKKLRVDDLAKYQLIKNTMPNDEIHSDIENKEQTEEKALFCRKCGAQLADDSLFCSKCGERL